MTRSLYSRVFWLYLLAVGIGLLLIGSATWIVLRRYDNIHASERIDTATRIAAAAYEHYGEGKPVESAIDYMLAATGDEIDLAIVDESAILSNRTGEGVLDLVLAAVDGEDLEETGVVRIAPGSRVIYVRRPIDRGASDGEAIRYIIGATALTRRSSVSNMVLVLALTLAGGLIAGLALFIHAVLRWIRRPIRWIEDTARSFAIGNLEVQTVPKGPAELVTVAETLNEMATELEHRLAAISDQRNQLEAILSSMVEGVIVLDRNRTIVSMNDAAGRLLNVDPAGATDRTLIEYLRNAQLDEIAESTEGVVQPIERSVTLYRDRPLHLQVHATALRDVAENETSGTLLVLNDITRLQHLEELRKDFVANVSHELKTPITSIKGFVETLLDGAADEPENSRRFLSIILNHADRLHAIIEDLLSLSRLEQKDQRITFYEFPIESVLASTIELCGPRADDKQISIQYRVDGEDHAWGNPNLIEQALVNLVDNAIKYSSDGSDVEIAVMCNDEMLRITVRDHGQGIRSRDLPRIFERFYRTDKARSRDLGGTGLGLAIVKHIARAHLGEVTVDSVLGEGSTFTVEIPQWKTDAELESGRRAGVGEWDALTSTSTPPD